ncbi:hypothetical protein AB0M02_27590 [Actinoplanes sp. NPDC051861]|uniref:hypothetical protein n=1 Tax=Actinoplanes sp. NPDC051861 TaxID=3155170 RepID=UPI00342ABE7A
MGLRGHRFWLSAIYAVIGAVLLVGAFLLLYPIRHTEDFGTQLRLAIGANLLDIVLAVIVLQPLVLFFSRNAVRWRNRLDYTDVIRRVSRSSEQVDIWKHWTGLLENSHEPRFLAAVRAALDRGVHFRIMLTDPSCPDAAERAHQVAPLDALALMRQNVSRLDAFIRELSPLHRQLFEVRISSVGPAHALYRVDDWMSYGLFRNHRVSESSQREVPVRGDIGELALEAFDARWNGTGLLAIADHYRMPLRFSAGEKSADHDLPYVVADGEHWVNVNPAALPYAFHPEHRVSRPGDGAARYVLEEPPDDVRERVAALYAAKYGPDQGAVMLRLEMTRGAGNG